MEPKPMAMAASHSFQFWLLTLKMPPSNSMKIICTQQLEAHDIMYRLVGDENSMMLCKQLDDRHPYYKHWLQMWFRKYLGANDEDQDGQEDVAPMEALEYVEIVVQLASVQKVENLRRKPRSSAQHQSVMQCDVFSGKRCRRNTL
jgi:hypothetical protein